MKIRCLSNLILRVLVTVNTVSRNKMMITDFGIFCLIFR